MAVPTRSELARSDDNNPITYIASGATAYLATSDFQGFRIGSKTGNDLDNYGAESAMIVLDCTAISGGCAEGLSLELELKDNASGKYLSIFSGGAISGALTTVGTRAWIIGPHFVSSGGDTIYADATRDSDMTYVTCFLPRNYRLKVHSGADNWMTYTVGISPVP